MSNPLDDLLYGIRAIFAAGVEVVVRRGLNFGSGLTVTDNSVMDYQTVDVDTATVTAGVASDLSDLSDDVRDIGTREPVRCVLTSLAAYTRTGNTILANAVGAIGAQDGETLVAGDRVLLDDAAAADPSDTWIYEVVTPGDGGTKYELERASDSDTSAKCAPQTSVRVEAGSKWLGSVWYISAAVPFVLNTGSPLPITRLLSNIVVGNNTTLELGAGKSWTRRLRIDSAGIHGINATTWETGEGAFTFETATIGILGTVAPTIKHNRAATDTHGAATHIQSQQAGPASGGGNYNGGTLYLEAGKKTNAGADGQVLIGVQGAASAMLAISSVAAFVGGGFRSLFTSTAAHPYTVVTTDLVILVDTTGDTQIDLLPVAANSGKWSFLFIKDYTGNAVAKPIDIHASGAELIDGANTLGINWAYGSVLLYCDGTKWSILAKF